MTVLEVAKNICIVAGLDQPSELVSSTEREYMELTTQLNKAGEGIARRVDWGAMTKESTLDGTGTSAAMDLPDDFARLTQGVTVKTSSGIVRPLSQAEWQGLTAVEGVPRYFLLQGSKISFYPFLAVGQSVTLSYQSLNWIEGAASIQNDPQTPNFPEDLLEKAGIYRLKRQKGLPYEDLEAEFEAAMADYANFDDRDHL